MTGGAITVAAVDMDPAPHLRDAVVIDVNFTRNRAPRVFVSPELIEKFVERPRDRKQT
jgi:hypothetical protein